MLTTRTRKPSPYLKDRRLADVIAALQLMGARRRPETYVVKWAEELSEGKTEDEVAKWTAVFREHPEFFRVYTLPEEEPALPGDESLSTEQRRLKAALRWRYTNKRFDLDTDTILTPTEIRLLPEEKRRLLTTPPLSEKAIAALINTAIELHSRALAELKESRWWLPVVSACVGFLGAVIGAFLGAHK
jgi:hypothetical protein